MRRLIFKIFLGFFLVSCVKNNERQQVENSKIKKDTIQQKALIENKDSITSIESDNIKIPVHKILKGETLWDLGKKYYANRHYSSIIKIYNKIENVDEIKAGTSIKIPDLKLILNDPELGFSPLIEKEVRLIVRARDLYLEVEKTLWDIRRKSKWKGKQNLPQDIINKLLLASDKIDIAASSLGTSKEGIKKSPAKMISRLKQVSRDLKKLASGSNDGYGYDLDMIHQNLIRAIHRGLEWVENDYN